MRDDDTYYSIEEIHNTLHDFMEKVVYRRTDNIPMELVNEFVKYAI